MRQRAFKKYPKNDVRVYALMKNGSLCMFKTHLNTFLKTSALMMPDCVDWMWGYLDDLKPDNPSTPREEAVLVLSREYDR